MKSLITYIILSISIIWLFFFDNAFWAEWIVNIPTVSTKAITDVSIQPRSVASGNIITDVNNLWFSILTFLKIILQWVLLIYMVYIWVSMIISMWDDEDKLTKSKNQIWYTLIALVFINIPWSIYQAINRWDTDKIDKVNSNSVFTNSWTGKNIFVDSESFLWRDWTIYGIISFLEVIIFWIALFVMIASWISIMISAWKDEKVTNWKKRILYSLLAIIFVWFIEAWKQFAVTGDLNKWSEVFGSVFDLALLFAWPVAMIFLTLAAYYYITSNGEEEQIKKAKSIIVNTVIWILLLLVTASFLNDLLGFSI